HECPPSGLEELVELTDVLPLDVQIEVHEYVERVDEVDLTVELAWKRLRLQEGQLDVARDSCTRALQHRPRDVEAVQLTHPRSNRRRDPAAADADLENRALRPKGWE